MEISEETKKGNVTMNVAEVRDFLAEDFIKQEEELREQSNPSEIQKFYEGTTILLTGATGFVGKILLEKLLRSCTTVKRIYVLLRSKKGKSIEKRMQEELEEPVYEMLLRKQPGILKKMTLINSDLTQDEILSEEDRRMLVKEVDIVFHCAATVRFDEKLRQAVNINVKSTKYLLDMAREMSNLKAFIHVSTAYANCIMTEIPEKIIPLKYDYKKIVELVNLLDDDVLERITPEILEKWQNTYVFTKAVAEYTVKEYGKGLPVGVFRPSIVTSTAKEPLIGWANNYYGPQGVVFGAGIGLLRVLYCDPKIIADMVPVDLVSNAIIAFGWDIAQTKGDNPNFEQLSWREDGRDENGNGNDRTDTDDITVMNYVSSNNNPIQWDTFMDHNYKVRYESYSKLMLWHSCLTLTGNYYSYQVQKFFFHLVPAVIVDAIAILLGKKPMLWKAYKKIHKFSRIISYFCLNQFKFEEKTPMIVWNKMSDRDKEIFYFNIADLNWTDYLDQYLKGLRVYLAKDDMSTLPEGRRKAVKLQIAHYTLVTFLYLLGFYMLWRIFSLFV
ncbi:hypothetical protein RUM44_004291 [Polyplax serrata]|uniref:Fatty acyl-CoA reductase n=2 Tax=Polyplax serrata TaxID=468196 RepID=A0ABR1B2E5_POLSC